MHIRIALSFVVAAVVTLNSALVSAQVAVKKFDSSLSKVYSPSNPSALKTKGVLLLDRRYFDRISAQPNALNKAVLAFAQSKLGQQVGRGECWDLAAQALIAAGAKPANGYTFGTVVSSPIPGDIIQFYNAKFVSGNSWQQMGTPNHTAVIESVNGSTITMLHQNVNGVRTVSRMTLNLATKTEGSYTFYRPTK